MEKILFIKNGNLDKVNEYLADGWKVKHIQTVSETVSSYAYGYAGGETSYSNHDYGTYTGDIFAYIVIEK